MWPWTNCFPFLGLRLSALGEYNKSQHGSHSHHGSEVKISSRVQNQSHLQNSPWCTPTPSSTCQLCDSSVGNISCVCVPFCTLHMLSHQLSLWTFCPCLQLSLSPGLSFPSHQLSFKAARAIYWELTMCQALYQAPDMHYHLATENLISYLIIATFLTLHNVALTSLYHFLCNDWCQVRLAISKDPNLLIINIKNNITSS